MDDMSLNLNLGLRRDIGRSHNNLVISSIDHSDMKIVHSYERKRDNQLNNMTHRERSNTLTEENNSAKAIDEPSPILPYTDYFKERAPMENGMNYFFEGRSTNSDHRSESRFNTGRWSVEEHQKFVEAMFLYGNEWKRVQQHIKTRSSTQARSHAQKFFIRLRKRFFEELDEDEKVNDSSTNERVFSWIKENVNWETINRVIRNSGNSCHNNLDPLTATESFLNDRKEKLCKIILNLISNSNKCKRKAFSNEDDSDSRSSIQENFKQINHYESNLPFLRNLKTNNKNNNENVRTYLNSDNRGRTIYSTNLTNSANSITNDKISLNKTPIESNYYNPNSNSYISIVTINLACPEKNEMEKNKSFDVNNNHVNNINGTDPIQVKQDFMQGKKNIQPNKNYVRKTGYNCNNVANTGSFNIINGVFNMLSIDKDQEKENEKDPFKLTFEENTNIINNSNMTPTNGDNDFCKINFDLDLDHFFNN